MSTRYVPIAFACAALLIPVGQARSRTIFDGPWSVMIITERGEACDRAYAYPIRIENGVVRYAGDFTIHLSGRVARNGAVRGPSPAGRGAPMVSAGCRGISAPVPGMHARPGFGRWQAERR
jgi:hypothetical protein